LLLRASTLAIAAVLAGMPVTVGSDGAGPVWKAALAEKGGNGGGGNGGGGGNHGGNQGNGHAYGHDKNGGGQGRNGEAEYNSFGDWVDDMRGGKAFGHARRDEHVEQAKGRYQEALGKARGDQSADLDENGEVAHRFSPQETKELIEHGWRARAFDDGFRNHGQRVHTMVELAKQLGYGARVGALQGHFGTPFENGIAELQAELDEARAAAAANPDDAEAQQRVEELSAELAAAIAAAKPGKGPDDSWATADLDVNDDGVVDPQDLATLDTNGEDETADASATPSS
jgi:hypothetical protein